MESLKVLLVEDYKMVRLGMSLIFDNCPDIDLAGEAADGKTGVKLALELKPDVVLMDIGLPETDGIKATEMIKRENPDIKVLMFTSRESDDDVFDALSAGADGYIMKGAEENRLITAIKTVAEGSAWLDPAIARLVLSNVRKNPEPVSKKEEMTTDSSKNDFGLTDREIEVLALMVEGRNNAEIADKLVISLYTAKAHVHSILQKLCVKNRTQASMQALEKGLIKQ